MGFEINAQAEVLFISDLSTSTNLLVWLPLLLLRCYSISTPGNSGRLTALTPKSTLRSF